MAFTNPHRARVLHTYKRLLQLAQLMPTKGRREWMLDKVHREYREDRRIEDMDEIEHKLGVAKISIENAEVMTKHLTRWLGKDNDPGIDLDPLAVGPEEPNRNILQYDYDFEKEWNHWLVHHPRWGRVHEGGTPEAIERWQKQVKNKRARAELLPSPPSVRSRAR
eukprot:TRINITY_DN5479_c0_g2_i1.p2 TRINITY_DN5479_c0_g2~~TRINITY_DN5479_c0_g2_i1.p2  ORF type:complete len:165 (+),score=38.53 TRINITY_DN5479_c0_g2_i1:55-549(+)